MEYQRFPPKNRRTTSLPILRIEIEHKEGTDITDPNGFILRAIEHGQDAWNKPLADRKSDISGRAAVLYRSDDFELALTPDEIYRLAMLALKPKEYRALRDKFGIFHEIHEDFYDPHTGEALQARWR